MEIIEKYLSLPKEQRARYISNHLHFIKYASYEECVEMYWGVQLPKLREEDKVPVIRFAVCLEHNLARKFGKLPEWIKSADLIANPAYLAPGYTEEWLFHAAQANYNHNYFCDRGVMEVI